MDEPSVQYPFRALCNRWQRALDAARKDRKAAFDVWADEAMNFFDGPANWMWSNIYDSLRSQRNDSASTGHSGWLAVDAKIPNFQMSVNRLFEAVALFGPALYFNNPVINVRSREMPEVGIETFYATNPQARQLLQMAPAVMSGAITDPNVVQSVQFLYQQYAATNEVQDDLQAINNNHSVILEAIANYIQQDGNKRDESRLSIVEAIITGLGIVETRLEQPPGGGPKMPRTRYRSNKDLLVDPDAVYWRDVTWIALRNVAPVNIVEEQFGLPPGSLKGKYARQAALEGKKSTAPRDGDNKIPGVNYDVIEYYEIYSKNGAGQHLKLDETKGKGKRSNVTVTDDTIPPIVETWGDYVKLVVCKECPYPLNLPPTSMLTEPPEQVLERVSWEVPYWDDYASDGGWPISRLIFYDKPGCVWPISMCKPVIGQLRFVNWCMSFIADKVSGDQIYVGVLKSAAENIQQQLTAGKGPYTIIELEEITGKSLKDLLSFMQAPTFTIDIWNMVAEVNEQIDKGLGLTELVYGLSSRQMRSAAEANNRQANISIRPDDMANRVEDWISTTATREIQCLRYLCDGQDVLPVVGPLAARVFEEQILTDDVSRITRDFTYRVHAGSARKPNRATEIAQLTELGQYILPSVTAAMQAGVSRPWNAYMDAMGRAMDFDVSEFLLTDQEAMQVAAAQYPPMPPEEEQSDGTDTNTTAA